MLIVLEEREREREIDREGGCWYGWSSLMKLGAFSCVGKGYNLYGNIFLSRTQGFLRLIKEGLFPRIFWSGRDGELERRCIVKVPSNNSLLPPPTVTAFAAFALFPHIAQLLFVASYR